jgi:hypothetical protein
MGHAVVIAGSIVAFLIFKHVCVRMRVEVERDGRIGDELDGCWWWWSWQPSLGLSWPHRRQCQSLLCGVAGVIERGGSPLFSCMSLFPMRAGLRHN